ncbi:hypothetical protein ACIF8T_27985 [Streptomyces sp. NPDC085946]|uniref:hypothetical protein n=1 Tax=Streptomyces sp. NPDC085946 TaxID=3365744 RepID=UPI0037D02AA7
MISTRRLVAAVGIAVGVTGLAAPAADAAGTVPRKPGLIDPAATLDSLALRDIPTEHRDEILRPSTQMQGFKRLKDLNQLEQLAAPVAPAFQLLPGIRT